MKKIEKIIIDSEYFDALSTLDCGQIFRFKPYKNGFFVLSKDKGAIIHTENNKTTIECYQKDKNYFTNFFDLDRDYKAICESAKKENLEILSKAVDSGKGIRILNQDKVETLFSFIISQNNNIPRIKGIIERLCHELGEKREFLGIEYFAFPTAQKMAEKDEKFYQSLGLGYRARYILNLAKMLGEGFKLSDFCSLTAIELRKELTKILGVGNKVADCAMLFGYHKTDSFPVDTWIEKVYIEDFKGKLKDRTKISNELVYRFGENAGYYQQYLFYYKRLSENNKKA